MAQYPFPYFLIDTLYYIYIIYIYLYYTYINKVYINKEKDNYINKVYINKNKTTTTIDCKACGILVPWPGIDPMPPAVEAWNLNHWTAREVPIYILNSILIAHVLFFKYLTIYTFYHIFL